MLVRAPTATADTMADVFQQAWKLMDVADQAERFANSRPPQSLNAEIVPGALSDWYVVRTRPGEDMRALRYLARRRFGVFRPMKQKVRMEIHPLTGHTIEKRYETMEPVYPGMLLVFCWDIEKMRSRILACPGVHSILCNGEGRAASIDVPDCEGRRFIEKLRELSFEFQTPNTRPDRVGARYSRRRPRPSRRIRKGRSSGEQKGA